MSNKESIKKNKMFIYRLVLGSSSKLVDLNNIKHLIRLINGRFQPRGNYLTAEQAEEQYIKKSDLKKPEIKYVEKIITKEQSDCKYQLECDFVYKSELSKYATKEELSKKADNTLIYAIFAILLVLLITDFFLLTSFYM